MVVWGYPCESKSSPAFKFKHPQLEMVEGVFLLGEKYMKVYIAIIQGAEIYN